MFAVRYVALAALVVWLSGMIAIEFLGGAPAADMIHRFHLVAYACGGIVLASLVVIKFVGPPPPAFAPRLAIVTLMLALALYADRLHQPWTTLMPINAGLGLVLLSWYVRE